MAHGVMEEWSERGVDSCSEKSPSGGHGRVMGSRRIFAPQFKLQVLDSYRQDPDCKGNQRATARKYGIHRRQIQKWLQMESHLRNITGGSIGAPSSPGGGSSVSLPSPQPLLGVVSPVPSPSPSSTSSMMLEHHAAAASAAAAAAAAALNLSCEARLLGAGVGVRIPSAVGGACSPTGSVRSPLASPSPRGSPACSPAPMPLHHLSSLGLQVSPVSVAMPRASVSPTLPIKKRWCTEQQETATSHVASDDDDDDDEDIDVDGTESEASSALDYTTATLSKRRSFSLQFKLEVLDAFREDPHCQGNQRATARAFGINRRQVQKWLGQEPDLRDEAVSRGGLNRQRLGRWMDQEDAPATAASDASDAGCLDLSRKRKHDNASDLDDAETEAKRSRVKSEASNTAALQRPTPLADVTEAFRAHPGLPPHPLLFRPQPVNLPLMPPLPLPLPLPFNLCAKQYSVDLKLSTLDLYTAHQQNMQKWFKPEEFLRHSNSFLLNSFR